MNKKLLFAAMSLAAFTACSNDEFQSQQAAEETSPVKFEVINDALTRASMDKNTIVWNANDGDLFTLYHGSTAAPFKTGYENATYKANAEEGGTATLTTPSMVKEGKAIMVWPVDTTFRIKPDDALTLKIPAVQENIEHNIPYVSDLVNIGDYDGAAPYNTAGKDRAYPVYMRPMASQLIINADYATTDKTLAELYKIDDPIEEIKVTSIDLLTKDATTTPFTTEIPLKFTDPTPAITDQWTDAANHNAWSKVTSFDIPNIDAAGKTAKLTTKCLTGNESCKFLILPQAVMSTPGSGVSQAGIVVNTIYGKVVVAAGGNHGSLYDDGEIADAWYRYVSEVPDPDTDGETTDPTPLTIDGKTKYKTTSKPEFGMKQTLNGFSEYVSTKGVTKGEPVGVATTRYVKVLLTHLDMTDLHIKNDKQLRDAARVWKKMGLNSVTVYLDGPGEGSTTTMLTQQTIKVINEINAEAAPKKFTVKPCQEDGEKLTKIWIKHDGSDIDDIQDLDFILKNPVGDKKVEVYLMKDENWKWNGSVKVALAGETGITTIHNEGKMNNSESNTLNFVDTDGNATNVDFVNDASGEWRITAGTIRVQNKFTNNGEVYISSGAQYHQDGAKFGAASLFINNAKTLPARFGVDAEKIGKVYNDGVFATVAGGNINNYGLIEHHSKSAMTFITSNQKGTGFSAPFEADVNMMGRINLPYSNKDEDNISINAALDQGFVSVTVDGDEEGKNYGALNASVVGDKVNYVIVKSGVTSIANMNANIKYVEFDMTDKSKILEWTVSGTKTYDGLMVLSPVNVKLGTTINVNNAVFLDNFIYAAGETNINKAKCEGYYGDTRDEFDTKYVTFK